MIRCEVLLEIYVSESLKLKTIFLQNAGQLTALSEETTETTKFAKKSISTNPLNIPENATFKTFKVNHLLENKLKLFYILIKLGLFRF